LRELTDEIAEITKSSVITAAQRQCKQASSPVVNPPGFGLDGLGIVAALAPGETNFKVGDRTLISCIPANGNFGMHPMRSGSWIETGEWFIGHVLEEVSGEGVRSSKTGSHQNHLDTHFADSSGVSCNGFVLTGFECGVLNDQIKPGDTVAIVGSARIGIAALLTAQLYSPAEIIMIDPDKYRLATAMSLGATRLIRSDRLFPVTEVQILTRGRGVDVAIDTIGLPVTRDLCRRIVTVNGCVTKMGAYGKCFDLHLDMQWSNYANATKSAKIGSSPLRLKTVIAGKLNPVKLTTLEPVPNRILRAHHI